ncbi:hypothetical protein cand_008250 [Cryptosporidium andersoni]|uniref:Trafficking protein particle complex subunit 11 domain-containing protein n=1 Tax=Cryptosporidium andersoni TaxID=117008 RepID=A0A1J4MPU4_9CRYT|nr:hypothetical protein cand_008250 [Cryptosporidium andersoni]
MEGFAVEWLGYLKPLISLVAPEEIQEQICSSILAYKPKDFLYNEPCMQIKLMTYSDLTCTSSSSATPSRTSQRSGGYQSLSNSPITLSGNTINYNTRGIDVIHSNWMNKVRNETPALYILCFNWQNYPNPSDGSSKSSDNTNIKKLEMEAVSVIESLSSILRKRHSPPSVLIFVVLPIGIPDPQSCVSCFHKNHFPELQAIFVTCGLRHQRQLHSRIEKLAEMAYESSLAYYNENERRWRKCAIKAKTAALSIGSESSIHNLTKKSSSVSSNLRYSTSSSVSANVSPRMGKSSLISDGSQVPNFNQLHSRLLLIRYCIKSAVMSEFCRNYSLALKQYMIVWDSILSESNFSIFQYISLCNLISLRFYHIYVINGDVRRAMDHLKVHCNIIRRFSSTHKNLRFLTSLWLSYTLQKLAVILLYNLVKKRPSNIKFDFADYLENSIIPLSIANLSSTENQKATDRNLDVFSSTYNLGRLLSSIAKSFQNLTGNTTSQKISTTASNDVPNSNVPTMKNIENLNTTENNLPSSEFDLANTTNILIIIAKLYKGSAEHCHYARNALLSVYREFGGDFFTIPEIGGQVLSPVSLGCFQELTTPEIFLDLSGNKIFALNNLNDYIGKLCKLCDIPTELDTNNNYKNLICEYLAMSEIWRRNIISIMKSTSLFCRTIALFYLSAIIYRHILPLSNTLRSHTPSKANVTQNGTNPINRTSNYGINSTLQPANLNQFYMDRCLHLVAFSFAEYLYNENYIELCFSIYESLLHALIHRHVFMDLPIFNMNEIYRYQCNNTWEFIPHNLLNLISKLSSGNIIKTKPTFILLLHVCARILHCTTLKILCIDSNEDKVRLKQIPKCLKNPPKNMGLLSFSFPETEKHEANILSSEDYQYIRSVVLSFLAVLRPKRSWTSKKGVNSESGNNIRSNKTQATLYLAYLILALEIEHCNPEDEYIKEELQELLQWVYVLQTFSNEYFAGNNVNKSMVAKNEVEDEVNSKINDKYSGDLNKLITNYSHSESTLGSNTIRTNSIFINYGDSILMTQYLSGSLATIEYGINETNISSINIKIYCLPSFIRTQILSDKSKVIVYLITNLGLFELVTSDIYQIESRDLKYQDTSSILYEFQVHFRENIIIALKCIIPSNLGRTNTINCTGEDYSKINSLKGLKSINKNINNFCGINNSLLFRYNYTRVEIFGVLLQISLPNMKNSHGNSDLNISQFILPCMNMNKRLYNMNYFKKGINNIESLNSPILKLELHSEYRELIPVHQRFCMISPPLSTTSCIENWMKAGKTLIYSTPNLTVVPGGFLDNLNNIVNPIPFLTVPNMNLYSLLSCPINSLPTIIKLNTRYIYRDERITESILPISDYKIKAYILSPFSNFTTLLTECNEKEHKLEYFDSAQNEIRPLYLILDLPNMTDDTDIAITWIIKHKDTNYMVNGDKYQKFCQIGFIETPRFPIDKWNIQMLNIIEGTNSNLSDNSLNHSVANFEQKLCTLKIGSGIVNKEVFSNKRDSGFTSVKHWIQNNDNVSQWHQLHAEEFHQFTDTSFTLLETESTTIDSIPYMKLMQTFNSTNIIGDNVIGKSEVTKLCDSLLLIPFFMLFNKTGKFELNVNINLIPSNLYDIQCYQILCSTAVSKMWEVGSVVGISTWFPKLNSLQGGTNYVYSEGDCVQNINETFENPLLAISIRNFSLTEDILINNIYIPDKYLTIKCNFPCKLKSQEENTILVFSKDNMENKPTNSFKSVKLTMSILYILSYNNIRLFDQRFLKDILFPFQNMFRIALDVQYPLYNSQFHTNNSDMDLYFKAQSFPINIELNKVLNDSLIDISKFNKREPLLLSVFADQITNVGKPFHYKAIIKNMTSISQEVRFGLVYPPHLSFKYLGNNSISNLDFPALPSWLPLLVNGIICDNIVLHPNSERILEWVCIATQAGTVPLPSICIRSKKPYGTFINKKSSSALLYTSEKRITVLPREIL